MTAAMTVAATEKPWEWWAWCAGFGVLPFCPLIGGFIILLLAIGVWLRDWRSICGDRTVRMLGIWLGFICASVVSSQSPLDSLLGAFNFLPLVFVFGALTRVLYDRHRLHQFAEWAIVIPCIGLCAIGLGELYAGWELQNFNWLLDLSLVAGGTPPGRMSSLFLHANALSNYAAIAFALALGLVCNWRGKSMPHWRWALLAVAGLAIVTMLLLASSRNAWGVVFLVSVACAIYHRWWSIVAAIGGAIAVVSAAAFAPETLATPFRAIVPYAIWGRLSDRMYPDRPIASLRVTQWDYALDLISDRPFLGWGLRSFSPLYEAQSGLFLGHPHNLYLMFAAETGTIATLVILVAVGGILTRTAIGLWRQRFAAETKLLVFVYLLAFLATSVYHILDVTLFNLPVNLVGWALLAGLVGIRTEARS